MLLVINSSREPISMETPSPLKIHDGDKLKVGDKIEILTEYATDVTFKSEEGSCHVSILYGMLHRVEMSGNLRMDFDQKMQKLTIFSAK